MARIIIILCFSLFLLSGTVFSQRNDIVQDKDEFEYLIGQKYTDVSDLGFFSFNGRTSQYGPDMPETSCTTISNGDKVIVLWEFVKQGRIMEGKIYEIQDILVLDKSYTSCVNCFISRKEGIRIKSFHSSEKMTRENAILAIELDENTRKIRIVKIKGLEWKTPYFNN